MIPGNGRKKDDFEAKRRKIAEKCKKTCVFDIFFVTLQPVWVQSATHVYAHVFKLRILSTPIFFREEG